MDGENTAIHIKIKDTSVQATLAVSYIGYDYALRGIENELLGKSFEQIKQEYTLEEAREFATHNPTVYTNIPLEK